MSNGLTPERVAGYFTRADGTFHFARWGRPLAPVVFGTDDVTLTHLKDSIAQVAMLGHLHLEDIDTELGANLLFFFVSDWPELMGVPDLDRLIPEMPALLAKLDQAGANQYRSFRFDEGGAIRLCIILLRMDAHLAALPVQTLATRQMVQSMLLWSDQAFHTEGPIALLKGSGKDCGHAVVLPEVAALIRAAYDPVLPAHATDPAHAHRLAARAGLVLKGGTDDP